MYMQMSYQVILLYLYIFKASQLSPEQLSEQLTALTTGQGMLPPQVMKSL